MPRRPPPALLLPLLSLVAVASLAPAAALTPEQRRGRQIYLEGSHPEGEIVAALGEEAIEVPAAALPCAGCHGRDGRGKPEGGVSPSNLTWPALTRPYDVRHQGRRHPPYDARSLKRAITMGLDPAGNTLHVAMPRYRLTLAQAADLVAYLRQLGSEAEPGVEPDALRLATVTPAAGGPAPAVLAAYFAHLNATGGVYGRRLEVATVEVPAAGTPEERVAAVRRALEAEAPFALVGGAMGDLEAELAALAAELKLPWIGPLAARPALASPPERHVFYLYSGVGGLARALAEHACGGGEGASLAVLFEAAFAAEARAAGEAGRGAGCGRVEVTEIADGVATGTAAVLALARREALAFLLATGGDGAAPPALLLPAPLAGEPPPAHAGTLLLAYPTLPADATPEGLDLYRRLAREHALPKADPAAQISTLAAGVLLVEGLKRAGRALTRDALVERLEALYQFDTGLTPPLTYDPNRRVGAPGAYLVEIDPATGRAAEVGERIVLP